MGEIAKPIGTWISENIPLSIGICIFIFCVFFEISKIKIYPLRWMCKIISWPFKKLNEQRKKYIKDMFNDLKSNIDNQLKIYSQENREDYKILKDEFTEMNKRFDSLDEKQKETEKRLDALAASRIKNHVLNFARQIRKGEKHSHEDFANLFKENEEYQKLVKKYDWINNVYKNDYTFIENAYRDPDNII